jgi:hypothetical protein
MVDMERLSDDVVDGLEGVEAGIWVLKYGLHLTPDGSLLRTTHVSDIDAEDADGT